MNELFNVKDKVVVITGGAGILGKGIAAYLAKEGAKVVVLDRSEEAGKALVDSIKAEGNEAMFLYTDVMDKEVLEGNKVEIMKAYGRIDVLLNAAGGNMAGATIAPDKTFFDLQIDAFKKVVDLNLFGTVLPTMVFAEIMVEQKKGSIVNFCSESALRPLTRVVGYGAAKAAIANFTKYMAGELALKFGNGLRVNAIAPGFFLTDQNRALLTNPDGSLTDRSKTILAHTPFNRFGEPVDYVTGPVIFGEPGTNGQHSFYQLLHQGTDIVPLQFIGFKNSQLGVDVDIESSTSQQKLCANVAAQIVAFACGKDDENNNKKFEGGRPSSIIIGDQLTPESLGSLLAHFENKIMFQGFIWNVNSFDQEGVQLGKVLAKRVLAHETDGALKAYSDLFEI